MQEENTRESIEVDVLIIGAGPAGLATAIKLKTEANKNNQEINIVVLEKGSEVGAHILSGAVIDPIGNFFSKISNGLSSVNLCEIATLLLS